MTPVFPAFFSLFSLRIERMFVYDVRMLDSAIALLLEAIDELAAEDVTRASLRDDLLVLERARARLDAETSRRLRAFDRSGEWAISGARSVAGYLVSHTRAARGEANHRVRVARDIDELDATALAWASGAVTTRHVEAIARARHAAHADRQFAEFEPALVETALAGTPEDVAEVARQWRDALDADLDRDGGGKTSTAEEEQERRSFDFSRSIHGMGFGTLTLDPLGAEFVETALNRAYDRLHRADDPRTPAQQRADALVEVSRAYTERESRAGRTNLPSVLVVTDEPTLTGDAVGECRLASGYRISPETARRVLCDAQVQEVRMSADGVLLSMSRATRTFTPDQFRAMVVRDAHCRGPACDVDPAHCEAHHLDEWERDDGPTDLDNGALFCRGNCHRMLHEGGWTVTGNPDGQLDFRDRQGRHIGSSTPHERAQPILTRRGKQRAALDNRIRQRASALRAA
jgi:hypothetical protein